ncbi:MAG: VWA domain-containing protein, partial [Actinobacteria bacterium]|nr:VWA domain-containing protein [Actinomycetota bacterium]
PLHLALVIDRSGSMAGPKLEVTKQAAAFLVRRLEPTDELALIAYDEHVHLVAPLAAVDHALLPVIASITPGGSTNLSGGWLKGVEEIGRASGDGPRKVLLLTDGQANVGVQDTPSLVTMARNAQTQGAGTSTIGFGADFSEERLTAMAEAGGGRSYYAASPEDAPGIFAEEFEGLLHLVAQNVSVEIRPTSDVQVLGILNDHPQVPVPGGVQVQLGDAFAEESRRVVFDLHVPDAARLGVATIAEVVVRYASVGEQVALHELTVPVTVNLVPADEAAAHQADAEVTEEVIVLKAARAQQEAIRLADGGDFEAAKTLLESTAEDLRKRAPHSERAAELLEQAGSLDAAADVMAPMSYDAASRKTMHFESYQRRQRRKPRPT